MFKKVLICYATLQSALYADATLAPSRLEVKDGYNMYLEGQFLWWLTKIDTAPIAQEGAINSIYNNCFQGHYKRLNTQFAPGGRLTFGGLMAYDHWDIHFTWTYFTQNASSSENNASYYLGNTFGFSNLTNYIRANYNISLNMLDAIMTRPSWLGERLAISPYLGVRGTWLDQVFKTKANLNPLLNPTQTFNIYNRSRSDFRGAGLLAGFSLRYELKSGWCIEGNLLTSGIYGKFVNYYSGYVKQASDSSFSSSDRMAFSRDPDQSMLYDVEFKLGIGYNRFLSQGRYLLGGGIAWEEVIFLNGNRLPIWNTPVNNQGTAYSLTQANPSSLLTLQGITFRFMFGF